MQDDLAALIRRNTVAGGFANTVAIAEEAFAMGKRVKTEPWANYHGDLPDYDHPLRCVFESGVQYTVELLAKELKVTDWTPCDGTEEYDGDLSGTLMNIVLAAMPEDEHGDPIHPRDLSLAFQSEARAGEEKDIDALIRESLLSTEFARTDVVNPVNGAAPYTYVLFHGQRVEFHDCEWATMNERDAGSGKAAAYAQLINDGQFELAKRSVRMGMERLAFAAPPAGEREERVGKYGCLRESLDRDIDRTGTLESFMIRAGLLRDILDDLAALNAIKVGDSHLNDGSPSHPLPADREAIAREWARPIAQAVMVWARPHLKHLVSFNTLCEAIEAPLAKLLTLSPTPSAGRDGSGMQS